MAAAKADTKQGGTIMANIYNQLCPVLFGAGALNQLPEQVQALGGTKALCLYDKGVEASGIAKRMLALLDDAKIPYVVYDGVQSDAPSETVDFAGELGRQEGCDIVIGIGGGSTLDSAKAATVLIQNPPPVSRYFAGTGEPFTSTTPLILIPTTSGTGSEVSLMAVVHDKDTQTKASVLRAASLAIVDPELTLTVPPHVTAMTGFDALSHAVEAFTTNRGNPLSDILCKNIIRLVAENLEKAYSDGSNLHYRTELALASNLAGIAFNDAFLHFGHAAAHEFGVVFHMPHGIACALTIPEVITFAAEADPKKGLEIAEALGLDVSPGDCGVQAGYRAASFIRSMMRRLNIPSLKKQGISREAAVGCAEGAYLKNPFITAAISPVDIPLLGELIRRIYDNYQ
jgi:alcohol dehydrogenase class IV